MHLGILMADFFFKGPLLCCDVLTLVSAVCVCVLIYLLAVLHLPHFFFASSSANFPITHAQNIPKSQTALNQQFIWNPIEGWKCASKWNISGVDLFNSNGTFAPCKKTTSLSVNDELVTAHLQLNMDTPKITMMELPWAIHFSNFPESHDGWKTVAFPPFGFQ